MKYCKLLRVCICIVKCLGVFPLLTGFSQEVQKPLGGNALSGFEES